MTFTRVLIVALSLMLTTSCSERQLDTAESAKEPIQSRSRLSYEELMSSELEDTAPISNSHFVAAENSQTARHDFSGFIDIPELPMHTIPEAIRPAEIVGKKTGLFPASSIEFFTSGEYLVPVVRDIVRVDANHSFWQIQVSPGRVWSEAGDKGYSRASFPFFLTSDIENESYNGVATFLYNDSTVSHLRYQLVTQSSPFLILDWFVAWDHVPISYRPAAVIGHSELSTEFQQELADRLPVKPWSELVQMYPEIVFDDYESSIDPAKTITTGLIIDDVIYSKPSRTPYGDFPYPEDLRLGVWSVTKSVFGLTAMLRMAEKFGDDIFKLKIVDYLDVTAEHDGWDEVTFGDVLNMATGIGTGSDISENNDLTDGYLVGDVEPYKAWYLAPTAAEKLLHVFRNHNHPWGPGEFVRYRDRDLYVLSAALASLLKEKQGPDADLSAMMLNEVYRPIGVHHLSFTRTKETAGEIAVPFMAWGMYMSVDDIAKIAKLLHNGGRFNNEQILSPTKLKEALYQNDIRGLPSGRSNQFGEKSYHMTMWHSPFQVESGDSFSIPEMHGWGGMLVALMPNGMTGYRLGNGGFKPHENMTDVAHKITPFTVDKSRNDK
jgi:CubicO group peptidase (beta-lactamase class C family)